MPLPIGVCKAWFPSSICHCRGDDLVSHGGGFIPSIGFAPTYISRSVYCGSRCALLCVFSRSRILGSDVLMNCSSELGPSTSKPTNPIKAARPIPPSSKLMPALVRIYTISEANRIPSTSSADDLILTLLPGKLGANRALSQFAKKRANLKAAIALHFAWLQFRSRPSSTQDHTRDGSRTHRPCLDGLGDAGSNTKLGHYPRVMAPSEAEATSAAYFAYTPVL